MRSVPWVKILNHHKLFLVYYSALLVALIVFYALPAYPGISLDYEIPPFTLLEMAIEGDLEEADWPIIKQDWNFSSPDTSLMITSSSREYLETTIVVAETAPEGRILVTEYAANSFLAQRLSAHQVSLSGTKLIINGPLEDIVELFYFSAETLTQFSPEKSSLRQGAGGIISPELLLYIQVPKGMDVQAEDGINILSQSQYR